MELKINYKNELSKIKTKLKYRALQPTQQLKCVLSNTLEIMILLNVLTNTFQVLQNTDVSYCTLASRLGGVI